MEQAIEQRGNGSGIAEELAPILTRGSRFAKPCASFDSSRLSWKVGARASVVCCGVMPRGRLRHPLCLSWA
jgi:hypothetical protein